MAKASVKFKVYAVSYGLNNESDPQQRRLRVGFIVYANPSPGATPPTINDGDLVLEVTIGQQEKKPERQPRFVATPDASPDGPTQPAKHRAKLTVKTIGSAVQTWLAEAEVPIIFKQGTSPWTTGTLLFQGKNVAQSQGRNWRAVGLNTGKTEVRQLATGTKVFPCFAAQLCRSERAVLKKDLSGHNYLNNSGDLTRLSDLTEELFARLDEGVRAIWSEAETDPTLATLYGGYPLSQREEWAFGNSSSALPAPAILGTKEQQQVDVANEVWARAITEIVTFSPYYGPGPGYFDGDIRTVEHDDDGGVTVEIRSRVEYDLAEGVSGSPRRGNDSFYPIVNACQHLATLAVLSRGWYLSASLKGKNAKLIENESSLNAGSQAAITYTTMLQPNPGSWLRGGGTAGEMPPKAQGDTLVSWLGNDSVTSSPRAAELVAVTGPGDTAFAPGSVAVFSNRSSAGYRIDTLTKPDRTVARSPAQVAAYDAYLLWRQAHPTDPVPSNRPDLRETPPEEWTVFSSHLADNTAAAHIGAVLRVDKSGGRFQVLDTGALNTGNAPEVWPNVSGVHDYPGTAGTMHGYDPYRGIGLAPVLAPAMAHALYDHANSVVEQARPLGLIRLVLARRGPDMLATNIGEWLLYASPLLRMYGNGATDGDRATLANLVWSLRNFPKREQARVIWSVRLPTGPLARAVMSGGKAAHVFDLVTSVMQELMSTANANPNKTTPRDRVRLYVNCDDVQASPPAGAHSATRRAWTIKNAVGAATLGTARILSRFTRVAVDYEANGDGTVGALCSLNAHGPLGYSGTLPRWHDAENAHSEGVNRPAGMLCMPLHSECGPMATPDGSWDPTPAGFADWVAQNNSLRAQVASALVGRFL